MSRSQRTCNAKLESSEGQGSFLDTSHYIFNTLVLYNDSLGVQNRIPVSFLHNEALKLRTRVRLKVATAQQNPVFPALFCCLLSSVLQDQKSLVATRFSEVSRCLCSSGPPRTLTETTGGIGCTVYQPHYVAMTLLTGLNSNCTQWPGTLV